MFLTKLQVVFGIASILHIFIVSSIVAVCNNTRLLSNLYDIEIRMFQDCFNWLFFLDDHDRHGIQDLGFRVYAPSTLCLCLGLRELLYLLISPSQVRPNSSNTFACASSFSSRLVLCKEVLETLAVYFLSVSYLNGECFSFPVLVFCGVGDC